MPKPKAKRKQGTPVSKSYRTIKHRPTWWEYRCKDGFRIFFNPQQTVTLIID